MSGQKQAVEISRGFRQILFICACFTVGLLVVSQCIVLYHLFRLKDEVNSLKASCSGLSKEADDPLRLKDRRSVNGTQYVANATEGSDVAQRASYINKTSPDACELCLVRCKSDHSEQSIAEEVSQRISCSVGVPGPTGPPGEVGPPGPQGPPGSPGNGKYNFAPPRFIKNLPRVVKVSEGQNVSVLCDVLGHPQPQVTWHKKKQTMQIVADQRWLNETNVQYENAGQYVCNARNFLNTVQSSFELLIYAKPRFVRRLPAHQTVYIGKTAVLQCMVRGYPKPVVKWLRMKPRQPWKHHVISKNSLTIQKISKEDGGVYVCRATSKFGTVYDGTLLTVRNIVAPILSPLPPKVTTKGHNASAVVVCTATGAPLPRVTWYRGDDALPTKRHVGKNKITAVLQLKHFTPQDEGVYKCIARNEFNMSVQGNTTIDLLHCGDPGTPSNGTKIGMKYWFGEMVLFSCNEGYRLKNSNIRICLNNGNWSGTQPECVPVISKNWVYKIECTRYSWLREANRRISSGGSSYCDRFSGWYRFSEAAGSNMLTSCIEYDRCGTGYTGWMVGPHPTVEEGKVSRTVCFSGSNRCCYYSMSISVRNCGGFYVYKLRPVPSCNSRFCGAR